MWTTVVFVSWLGAGEAAAREYALDPRASAISLDDEVRLVPKWIDASRVDYVLLVEVQNTGREPLLIRSSGLRCVRGAYEGPATYGASFGIGERSIDLAPGEVKAVKLLCDHGANVTGDFALKISEITRHTGDGATPAGLVFQNVTWRLGEGDVDRDRQAAGQPLATGSYDRPPHVTSEPEIVAVPVADELPLAIPPTSTLPPPPAATLRTPGG